MKMIKKAEAIKIMATFKKIIFFNLALAPIVTLAVININPLKAYASATGSLIPGAPNTGFDKPADDNTETLGFIVPIATIIVTLSLRSMYRHRMAIPE